jgi:hypothetical protein
MRDAVVYIHGLVPEHPGPHTAQYRALHDGLVGRGVDLPAFDGPDVVKTEIWWDSGQQSLATANLARAQRNLGFAIGDEIPRRDMLTGGLMRGLRHLLQYAWSDAFYYTAPDGEERTRQDVWDQILGGVTVDDDVDLTVVCHSGGTLVAHDFLFYLFSGDRDQERSHYADASLWNDAERRWRIKMLVTMGSPLAPLMVRSVGLVDALAGDETFRLDLAKLGFDRGTHGGATPQWLNLWDVHDILSFPVAGLYGDDPRIKDLYPDVGDWPASAHDRYWSSRRSHSELASHWA